MLRKAIITILLFYSVLAFAQPIEVDVQDKPLNLLLLQWQEAHALQFSFNDDLLAQHLISSQARFRDIEAALDALLNHLPLAYEKTGEVYVIYPKQSPPPPPKTYHLIGRVLDDKTNEPLAYSVVQANGINTTTDISGMFSFAVKGDSVFQVAVRHLGCVPIDTVLVAGERHVIAMQSALVKLKQLEVVGSLVDNSISLGYEAGQMNLNHYVANYLPGNGDNSVFNYLKMHPGILAAGEMADEMVIWGSYAGTSRVKFDGFTLFGLNNFDDNISAVNPFMVKDIEVLKGGYGADKDDVVGGIVNINGNVGARDKPHATIFVNNQTFNGAVELPISDKVSLLTAYRQTYRTLLDKEDVLRPRTENDNVTLTVHDPDYLFRDFNTKLSYRNDAGDLMYLSFLRGSDQLDLGMTASHPIADVVTSISEANEQMGASFFYGKTWKKGMSTALSLFHSSLANHYALEQLNTTFDNYRRKDIERNDVMEQGVKLSNEFLMGKYNTLTLGAEWAKNAIVLVEDTFDVSYVDIEEEGNRSTLFIEDEFKFKNNLSITLGGRYNYFHYLDQQYFDPRLALSVPMGSRFKSNISWGQYHQFLVKSSMIDADGNYRYRWGLANGDDIKVEEASHAVFEIVYNDKSLTASACVFSKNGNNITRYIRTNRIENIFIGNFKSQGLDLYAKKDINAHSLWASYSLAKTEEIFPYLNGYRRSAQDQRHELKLGGLMSFKKVHVSLSYIYGSGFPVYENYLANVYTTKVYNRLDLAFTYLLPFKSFNGEVGISVLNALNADNEKYSTFERVPNEQTTSIPVVNEAIPFTPLVFLKVEL